jgi:hypothetical protein
VNFVTRIIIPSAKTVVDGFSVNTQPTGGGGVQKKVSPFFEHHPLIRIAA